MTPQLANRGLVSVDVLRGLAAGGVFYYHQHIGALLAKVTGLSFFGVTDLVGSNYAVPLFFLLSGFCIHLPNIKYLKENQALPLASYLKRRFLRIYPPYLVALIFSLVVNFITLPAYTISGADLLAHIFLVQGFTGKYFNTINVVMWTISVEFALYLLYPFFYHIRRKTTLKTAMGIVFLVSVISISVIEYFVPNNIVSFFFVFNLWFAWCCGAFIAECKVLTPDELKKPIYKLFYVGILLGYLLLSNTQFLPILFPVAILAWTAPLVIFLNLEPKLAQSKSFIIKLLTGLGLSSYSLYLLHEPLIYLKNFLVHWVLPSSLQTAGFVLGILMIPVVTWFSYRYIERPFTRKKIAVIK